MRTRRTEEREGEGEEEKEGERGGERERDVMGPGGEVPPA
jgi:hypothetical protein